MEIAFSRVVLKSDDEERVVFGEVFAPMRADTYTDVMTAQEIKKAAYNFMKNMRLDNIDVMHNLEKTGSYIVEFFIVRQEDDPDGFLPGSWVVAIKIEDPAIWDQIISGDLNGLSLYGEARKQTATVKVDRVTEISGITEVSLDSMFPPHTHDFHIKFDANDSIVPTFTSDTFEHTHGVVQATATEESHGHGHRFSVSE